MKVVILAGGQGTRLNGANSHQPKPMTEIGGQPLIWHIMKHYAAYGLTDFIICCGYKAEVIQDYFATHNSGWQITPVDTGLDTMTGGRLKRVKDYLDQETFCLTYGDGVSDVNLAKLIEFHHRQNRLATVTAVHPPENFGILSLNRHQTQVVDFKEKPRQQTWINGGFFVLEPQVLNYIQDDTTVWEQQPLEQLTQQGQLAAFKHEGFWQCMDTFKDKQLLENLWHQGSAPWKIWEDSK